MQHQSVLGIFVQRVRFSTSDSLLSILNILKLNLWLCSIRAMTNVPIDVPACNRDSKQTRHNLPTVIDTNFHTRYKKDSS
jgi:hypothetical protein